LSVLASNGTAWVGIVPSVFDLATEPAPCELVERAGQVLLRQAGVFAQSHQVGVGCSKVGWLGHDRHSKPSFRCGPKCPLDVPEPTLLWALSVVI
jgi:hypothetical protein